MTAPVTGSFSDFLESLREVDMLLAMAPREPARDGGAANQARERNLMNALTRSCVVMLVASFEGFIKSVLTDLIDAICQAKPPARRIPDALLELHTRERIEEIFGTEGPNRIYRTRRLFTTYAQLWDENHSINPNLLSAKILTRQFTNARPEVIESVFSLLGVEDVLSRIDAHVNQVIASRGDQATSVKTETKLAEIVERRNRVAHGDRSELLTPIEVENYKVFLTDVAEMIDKIIQERIKHCCSLL